MSASFTREQIEAIATLAHLELDPLETDLFARQLSDILAYAAAVQQVDTTGIQPTSHVGAPQADREDEVRPSLERTDALENAPDASPDGGLFRVPRVIG